MNWQKLVFLLFISLSFLPFISPVISLVLGLFLALSIGNPFPEETVKYNKILLRGAVVLLGFGMNLSSVVKTGKDGLTMTIVTIFGTLLLGYLLGKALKINDKVSSLISAGTAVCGGSAIAAVAPAIRAKAEEASVSLGTVFILNAVALLIFPAIGSFSGMTDQQFGIWSAVAIHDTSSVVGASQVFSHEAQQIATTVKLSRALWIAPVALLFAYFYRPKHGETNFREMIPWFILFFFVAIIIRTYTEDRFPPSVYESLVNLAKKCLNVSLFLIGATLTLKTLKEVGLKPLLQAVILWVVVSALSFAAVFWTIK